MLHLIEKDPSFTFTAVFPCGYSLYTKCRLIYPPKMHAGLSQPACCRSQTYALRTMKAYTFNSLQQMACHQIDNDYDIRECWMTAWITTKCQALTFCSIHWNLLFYLTTLWLVGGLICINEWVSYVVWIYAGCLWRWPCIAFSYANYAHHRPQCIWHECTEHLHLSKIRLEIQGICQPGWISHLCGSGLEVCIKLLYEKNASKGGQSPTLIKC
jgi:hypothetical protein